MIEKINIKTYRQLQQHWPPGVAFFKEVSAIHSHLES